MKKLFFFLFVVVSVHTYAQTKNFIDQPYVEVTGHADTFVVPNEIFIKIVISEKDSRDRVSVEQQETNLITGLSSIGVNTDKDLSVFDFGSNYRFYLLKKKDVIKTKQYTLKVSDAVMVSKVFMKLEELDLSNAYIDRVNHTELESFKNKTRSMAIVNAKANATSMVQPIGQIIGNAIFISDHLQNEKEQNIDYYHNGDVTRNLSYNYDAKYKSETPRLEFEKIQVSSTVTVKFVLK